MKIFLVGLLLLPSCSPVRNTFEVQTGALPATATLLLCGKETPLRRSGQRLRLRITVACEGHGEVQVAFEDGRKATCSVGYVTPGLSQIFRFKARGDRCDPIT